MRLQLISLGLLLSLAGCSSDKPMINTSQSLVMESSVLSAGIITDEPTLAERDGQKRASSVLYNQRETPVTVHYRFYWYDDKGLEIEPQEPPQTFTVPAHGSAEVISQTGNLTASKVRLYLYL
ncbi:YcfL family protein [Pantoea osteomyelitidis]|uniref:YcfL family protein n=1 Tax=Pantoea osteomyelitidis TaxID=3230026 RepID=A0ABW7PV11_9GAMM